MSSPLIITLVHGTWGKNSAFTRPNSALRRAIRDLPNPKIGFLRFSWSGANGNFSRLKASNQLSDFLSRAISKYPDHKHIVIAHSHAGNILLYALEDSKLCSKIAGVITVGTPFLIAHQINLAHEAMNGLATWAIRNPKRSLRFLAIMLPPLIFLIADSDRWHLSQDHVLESSPPYVFLLILFAVTGLIWGFLHFLKKQFRSSVQWCDLLQVARNRSKMLCLFVNSDEAGTWLAILSKLRKFLDGGLVIFTFVIFAIAAVSGLVSVLASAPAWLIEQLGNLGFSNETLESAASWLSEHAFPFILTFGASIGAMVLIPFLVAFLDLLVFATPAGFGIAEWRHGWFVKQTSSLKPPAEFAATIRTFTIGEIAQEVGWFKAITALRHSVLFQTRTSLDAIKAFIVSCDS